MHGLGTGTLKIRMSTMTIFSDSTIVYPQCHGDGVLGNKTLLLGRENSVESLSTQDSVFNPSVPLIIRNSLSWTADTLRACRYGISNDERKHQMDVEDLKQTFYFRMRNVRLFCQLF